MLSRLFDSTAAKIAAGVVALIVVVSVGYELFKPSDTKTAVAYFPAAVHLYTGSEVDVLGVKVGTVTSVIPQGDRVRVELSYSADQKIPANAAAVVDEPTLVADRVVELTPPYGGGQVLADGATIPLARTQVPVELDELTGNLVDLARALGPDGANRTGALGRALSVAADNMRGNGELGHTTVTQLSRLMGTLGDNRDALFRTIRSLQSFSTELADHDAETRAFTGHLAQVSQELADDGNAFTTALHDLGTALDDVARFVRDNRSELSADVDGLAKVSTILARERVLLAHIADMGAVGISNYPHMYTPSARTYNARFDGVAQDNPALFFCQLYDSVGGSPEQCIKLLKPLNNLPLPTPGAGR